MYLTIQDFEKHITLNGIPPLLKETEDLLASLEKSLDVESIELSILQYQQEKAQEKAALKSQTAATGENKYKNKYNNNFYQKKHEERNTGDDRILRSATKENGMKDNDKWSKNGSHTSSSTTASTLSKSGFHARNGRNTHSQPSSSSVSSLKEGESNNKWVKYVETIGEFKPTKLESKEGIEKTINEIRINLNKMTKKNYEIQRNKIIELIEHILREEKDKAHTVESGEHANKCVDECKCAEECINGCMGKCVDGCKCADECVAECASIDPLHKIAQFIFDISSSNKFFTEIYATLYKELIDNYKDIYTDILNTFILNFKESIQTFSYCDPNTNYEKYCEFIKEGDRKKAITTFIIMLLNRGVIPPSVVIEITDSFQTLIQQYIKEEGRVNEIEELGEILYILVSLGNDTITGANSEGDDKKEIKENNERWNNIIHQICNFTTMKVKEEKSLSTRFIFKMKDLYDLL
jgi:hypothetical protein